MCFFKKKKPQKSTAVFTLYKIQQLLLQNQTIMNIECKKPNYCVENSKTYKLCDYKKKWKKKYRPNAPKCYFFNFFYIRYFTILLVFRAILCAS